MRKVVTIPGYSDFHSFSRDFHELVQGTLNYWQKVDGVFHLSWIRGISGKSKLSPLQMKRQMDSIFRIYLSFPVPVWLMGQIEGIQTHAMLVHSMRKTPAGYTHRWWKAMI